MAHTAQGRQATESHRKAQVALTAYVVSQVREVFRAEVDAGDISGTFARFVKRILPVILRSRRVSTQLSRDYLKQFRAVELHAGTRHKRLHPPKDDSLSVPVSVLKRVLANPWPLIDPEPNLPDAAEITEQLYLSGPAVAKQRIKRGKTPEDALKVAETRVATTATRLTGDGGRAVIEDEVAHQKNGAIGYCRVPDADPCPFCAMLASRGPVYKSNAFEDSNDIFTGDGRFKVHNGCDCTMEPVYGRRVTDLPPGVDKLAKEWAEIASGRDDPFAYWRRYKESGTMPGEERAGSNGTNDAGVTTAPQKGREYKRGDTLALTKKKAKALSRDEKRELLKQQTARLEGLKRELAGMQERGMSVDEPGPAKYVAKRIERVRQSVVLLSEEVY